MADFGDAQAGCVGGHECCAVAQVAGRRQDAGDFGAAEDFREALRDVGAGQVDNDDGALEDAAPEETQGLQGLVAGGRGQVLPAQQVEQEALQVGGFEQLGCGLGLTGQFDGPMQIGFAGALGKGAQFHGVEHGLA